MSEEMLELTVDKFTFRVPEEVCTTPMPACGSSWKAAWRGLGLSDFAQQRSGDMAFVEVETRRHRAQGRRRVCQRRDDQGEHRPAFARERQDCRVNPAWRTHRN